METAEQTQSKEIRFLKASELKPLKEELHEAQGGICPILGIPVPLEDMVVDHKHAKKSIPLGENGNGCARGAISRFANIVEGKAANAYIRTGLEKTGVPLSTILRNLADYLDNPPAPPGLVHPTEVPKEKKLGKRVFNQIAKLYLADNPTRKPLEYPKSGKPTKQIKELAEKYQISL